MATETVERKYGLTKIKSGDWLLPSNDAQTMFRLSTYVDGPTNGLDIPKDREFWMVHSMSVKDFERLADYGGTDIYGEPTNPLEWEHWEYQAGLLESRKEAIEEAIKA